MRFLGFRLRRKDERRSSHKETVFAEASELAQLGLEQGIAGGLAKDLRYRLPACSSIAHNPERCLLPSIF